MTQVAHYADRMDLAIDKPNGSLTSTGYMLANPGTQYLAFAPNGGSFTVNLSAGSGSSFSVEWFNVSTGSTVMGASIAGGSSQQAFTPPFSSSAVLFLNKSSVAIKDDFNNDGRSDILWQQNNGTGVWIWEMNGTTPIGGGSAGAGPASYHIVGTGDFNNDGKSDILWQQDNGTGVYIWEMDGTTQIGGGSAGAGGASWHIV